MILGLTGGIASGKSTAAQRFVQRGFRHVDADALARVIVEPGTDALREIAQQFGAEMLLPDGRLDRTRLGRLVFADPQKLAVLNAITHPRIAARIAETIQEGRSQGAFVLLDHPLLYETGQDRAVDRVAVVWVDRDTQMHRLRTRNGLTAEEAQQRIGSQMDLDEKSRKADFILDNTGPLESLQRQVDTLCDQLGLF